MNPTQSERETETQFTETRWFCHVIDVNWCLKQNAQFPNFSVGHSLELSRIQSVPLTRWNPTASSRMRYYSLRAHKQPLPIFATSLKEVIDAAQSMLDSGLQWHIDWLSRVSRPTKHITGHTGDGFCGSNNPANSVKALKEVVVLRIDFNPTRSSDRRIPQRCDAFPSSQVAALLTLLLPGKNHSRKFSPVWDWRSTHLEWLSITCDLDLDLESGHTACCRASLIDLYVHIKFHWNRKNFFWTD